MKLKLALIAAALFALSPASVVYATPQQEKMKTCNVEAKDMKGAERKAFMKECLSGGSKAAGAATEACAAKAIGKNGKPLAGAARASFMKKCEKDAGAM